MGSRMPPEEWEGRHARRIEWGGHGVKNTADPCDVSSGPELLLRVGARALEAVHPDRLLPGFIEPVGASRFGLLVRGRLHVFPSRRLVLIALGKAAPSMAAAAMRRVIGPFEGVGVGPGRVAPILPGWQWWQADHPVPSWRSVHAAGAVRSVLAGVGRGDLVVVLVSGGASALACWPCPGVRIEEIAALTRSLLLGGSSIHALNVRRREVDLFKAGGVARWASPAQTIGLILSDVPGNALWAVGSGPTVTGHPDAKGATDRWPFPPPVNVLVGSNETALSAAERELARLGLRVHVRPGGLQGPARALGERLAEEARHLARTGFRGCLLLGGEPSVEVRGDGVGGRCTELALSIAMGIAGCHGVWALTLATDGTDGVTTSAGALVGPQTVARGIALGLDPQAALARNDSWTFLERVGATIRTGPTGTNVSDIAAILIDPEDRGATASP